MNIFLQNTITLNMRIQDKATPAGGKPKRENSIGKFVEKRRIGLASDVAGGRNSPQARLKLP